jgi:hypothetical protein
MVLAVAGSGVTLTVPAGVVRVTGLFKKEVTSQLPERYSPPQINSAYSTVLRGGIRSTAAALSSGQLSVVPGGKASTTDAVFKVTNAPMLSYVPMAFKFNSLLNPRVFPVKVMAPFIVVVNLIIKLIIITTDLNENRIYSNIIWNKV